MLITLRSAELTIRTKTRISRIPTHTTQLRPRESPAQFRATVPWKM
nr:uncharacterized protein CTRU02_00585 [Colletotrichum truncatum]KAF6801836.1 hypothetical protein CTRU02_00585 [Colletotrichum truncatum]